MDHESCAVARRDDECSRDFCERLTGTDQWHFDLASQREPGTRYGEKMQELLVLP